MIDAHRHYWHYQSADYPWIGDELSLLRADFLPQHAKNFDEKNDITGVIAVQARGSEVENDWLLSLAKASTETVPIIGIVGWLDLCSNQADERLQYYKSQPLFKGFRHIVQDEPNPQEFWQRQDFSRGVNQLQKQGFVYDLLAISTDLPSVVAFSKRHDQAWLVLDHLGKPTGKDADFPNWVSQIKALAALPHTAIKLSGLPLILGDDSKNLARHWQTAIHYFGVERCLWGSDYPVCTLTHSAEKVLSLWQDFIKTEKLSENEQLQIEQFTATQVYQLEAV